MKEALSEVVGTEMEDDRCVCLSLCPPTDLSVLVVSLSVYPSVFYTVYLEILEGKKFVVFTPNRAFKNIVGILIWWQIHESRMHSLER